jgi:hypothetical protein
VIIAGDVKNMDDKLISILDGYVKNGGKLLATAFTSTSDEFGKPLNSIRLQCLGVNASYELFRQARSTYLKVSQDDKAAFGKDALKDFSIMMMYSDLLQCKPSGNAKGLLRLVPSTRFGPPEKSYYTADDITSIPGLIFNNYEKGKTVFIPWEIGRQYQLKGNYAQRQLFVASLKNLLEVKSDLETNAPALVEMSHQVNRSGAFEWIGLINHSGQIGGSLREPVMISNTSVRFKPAHVVKAVTLLRSGKTVNFKQTGGWLEVLVPQLTDFEMIVCTYR